MKTDFCKHKVIHDFDLNLSFFLVTFLKGACLSKIALILLKKLLKERFTSLPLLIIEFLSTEKYSNINFSWTNLNQSLS